MFTKTKLFLHTKAEKLETVAAPLLAIGASVGLIPTVFAGATAPDPADAVKTVVGIVFKIFRYIGIILALWGVGSLVMAFKNEDADSKSRAIMSLIVGVCLVGLEVLFGDFITGLIA